MMRDPVTDGAFRHEVCDWLRANGVDPNRVPIEPKASIADGQLTILRKVQRNGGDVIHPTVPYTILTETITVPVVVPPSPDIAEWLRVREALGAEAGYRNEWRS